MEIHYTIAPSIEHSSSVVSLASTHLEVENSSSNIHSVEVHTSQAHEISCEECAKTFDDNSKLNMHIDITHDKSRGTKRHRHETSLLSDPLQCTGCEQSQNKIEQLNNENKKLKEQFAISSTAYEQTKLNLNSTTTELEKQVEVNESMSAEVMSLKAELNKRANSSANTNDKQDALRKDYEMVKQMVVDRDKTFQKIEETNNKEIINLKAAKKASEDALNIVTEENTRLKDKEGTLIDIFKCMKQHMDEQLSKCSPLGTASSETNTIGQEFKCTECQMKFSSTPELNNHQTNVHRSIDKTCTQCNFEAQTNSEFRTHIKACHVADLQYTCSDCNFKDLREINLINHRIANHPRNSCDKCPFQTSTEALLNKHTTEEHKIQIAKQIFKCDDCGFSNEVEENLQNHQISNHSVIDCDLCEYNCTDTKILEEHMRSIHKQSKFTCVICHTSYNNQSTFREHIKMEHKLQIFPCDFCDKKEKSLSNQDEHIGTYHRITTKLKTQTREKQACDFRSPQHSSKCCDRDQGKAMKIYTPQERLENGPCQNWNESICRFSDLCRYAHVEICRFQERWHAPLDCWFFHFNDSNFHFLGGTTFRKSVKNFNYNIKDFPSLPTRNQNTQ